jgi:branched-chain amino acid transport system permease protein
LVLVEQSLNGLQFGLMLFLLAAGLTLVAALRDLSPATKSPAAPSA